jgi:hypothetical protein
VAFSFHILTTSVIMSFPSLSAFLPQVFLKVKFLFLCTAKAVDTKYKYQLLRVWGLIILKSIWLNEEQKFLAGI